MEKYVTLYHHYCPVVKKNIVIERSLLDDDSEENICLNRHQCNCDGHCENKLFDLEIKDWSL